MEQYHVVRGRQVHGLIVDQGAATGVAGTDTVSRFVEEVLKKQGLTHTTKASKGSFSGIDGETVSGYGRVSLPIGLPGLPNATYSADLLGGQGSSCPMLLPNSTMMRFQMSTFANIMPLGDGVLMVRPLDQHSQPEDRCVLFPMLLADSGH